jgi:hypothetical protein
MRRTILSLALLLLGLAGCLGNRLPPDADPARGREALTTVLDTWARGGRPEDLKKASPSIVVSDSDWEAGHQLLKSEVDPTDGRIGVDLQLVVTLTLKTPTGQTSQKKVTYVVSTSPGLTVLRGDPPR